MSHTTPSLQKGTMQGARPPKRLAGGARLSAVAAFLLASAALAQEPRSLPAFELERLELNPNGRGSLLTGTGELLPKGDFRFSLAGQYEDDPLIRYRSGKPTGSVVENRVMAHLLAAWAPLQWLELGVQLPLVAWQRGDEFDDLKSPTRTGLSTPTAHVRVGLLSQQRAAPVDLALELGMGLPVGSVGTLSRDSFGRLSPKVMVGRSFGLLRAGMEAGVLIREPTHLGANLVGMDPAKVRDEVGSEVRLGAMLATTGKGLRGELNVRGAVPLTQTSKSLEVLAGVRLPVSGSLEAFAMGGPGFGMAPGTPTFRVLLGMAMTGTGSKRGYTARRDDTSQGVSQDSEMCAPVAAPPQPQLFPVKDTDRDGTADATDKCPTEAGPAERQGCPEAASQGKAQCAPVAAPAQPQVFPVKDTDRDGTEDAADKCPTEMGPAERQGCPLKDADNDGVVDGRDACVAEAGLIELRGCPAKDTDGDTLSDHLDNCPAEKGEVSNAGCPAAQKQLVIIRRDRLEIKEQVFFATNQAIIRSRSFKMLDQVVRILQQHPEVEKISVEGHTDDRGNAELNRKLSQARANAVKGYLMSKGVEPSRLEAKGFGPDRPLASNQTDAGRAANRRVEFLIVPPEHELR